MIYHVHVREEDILLGKRKSSEKCALAIALERIFRDHTVSVEGEHIRVTNPEGDEIINLTTDSALKDWIWKYDQGMRVQEITVELDDQKMTATLLSWAY